MPKTNKADARLVSAGLPLDLGQGPDDDKKEHLSVLVFEVGGVSYAIGVESTEGVVDCPRIAPLPSPPDGVAGIVSVRGRMTVVMDLGLNTNEQPARRRLILVKGEAQLGLLADRIEGVVALKPKKVRTVNQSNEGKPRREFHWPAQFYFTSGKRRVPILEVDRLCEG